MRVLHVISNLDRRFGGPVTALMGLAAAQVRAGLSVSVAGTYRGEPDRGLSDIFAAAGVSATFIGPGRGPLIWTPRIAPTLRKLLTDADIVHIHTLWESIQHRAAVLARGRGVPYLTRPCGMLDPWSLSQRALKKRVYLALRLRNDLNRAAAIHYTTHAERDLAAPLGLTAPPLVVPNGIDLAEFASLPDRGAFRAKHPTIGNRKLVMILGRIDAKKGFDLLIPAFARLKSVDSMLAIAGPDLGGYEIQVRAMVDQFGLRERVLFTGMLRGPDRVEALAAADLFVLPSYQENFGIAVVEALAAGCPVIVSENVNIQDEIVAAGVGAAVPRDVARLASEMGRWLGDDRLRQGASTKARPLVQSRFDWNMIAQEWAGGYARLTRGSMPERSA